MPLSLVTWTSRLLLRLLFLLLLLRLHLECCVMYAETIQGLTFYHSNI